MDQIQREPTFEESIKQVMQTLPPPIRNYLGQGKYSVVANRLMAKYSLHVDQGGILENGIMLLLMGVDTPEEFATALKDEAKISENILRSIMTDINQEIFVPLREEMRKSQVAEVKPPQPQRSELRNVLASVTKEVPHAPLGTSQGTAKLLEDHEEPHIEFKKTAAPPANLPGVIHHPPLPTPPPILPTKPYSSDPYREPIDEK